MPEGGLNEWDTNVKMESSNVTMTNDCTVSLILRTFSTL